MNDIRRAKLSVLVNVLNTVNEQLTVICKNEYEARKTGTFSEHIDDLDVLLESRKSIENIISNLTTILMENIDLYINE